MKHKSILSISMVTIMLLTLCAVCTTTSVSAVPAASNIGPAVTPWSVSTAKGFNLYYVGASDHRMYWSQWQDYDPSAYVQKSVPINAWTYASPAAINRVLGSLGEIFHSGTDGAIYYKAVASAQDVQTKGWTRLTPAGTADPKIGPAVSGWTSSDGYSGYDLYYVRASDHQICWSRWQDQHGSTAAGWTVKDKPMSGWTWAQPAAVSRFTGVLELFHTGTDGWIYHKVSRDGGQTWGGWARDGALPGLTQPAVTTIGPGVNAYVYKDSQQATVSGWCLCYVRASDHQICFTKWQDQTGTYPIRDKLMSGWTSATPAFMARNPSGTQGVAFEIFHTGSDGYIYQTVSQYAGDSWTPWARET